MSPRWMKVWRDMRLARGRLLTIVAALAVSIVAVVGMANAYSVLAREVPANYQGSNPASVQLETEGRIDAALLAQVASQPNIASAELAGSASARVEVAPGKWLPMRIFVVPDFASSRINTLGRESGAWPPPTGTLLIERSALPLSGGAPGRSLAVEFRQSGRHYVPLGGVVHDPGLAPAWQEQVLYGYATPQTLARYGQPVALDLLKIVVKDGAGDTAAIERTARALSVWLEARGVKVHAARIPPPGQHPHQSQMNAVLLMLLVFSLLVLLLGGVLTAAIIGGLLSQQVRQIAIMKAVGALPRQIAAMYLGLVGALALAALAIALPLGTAAGRGLIAITAELLNLRISSTAMSWALVAATVLLGLAVPLAAALAPVLRASRITVQAAMQDHDVSRGGAAHAWTRRLLARIPARDPALTLALRNLLRRRARLFMTLFLLSGAGAMFITSMNLRAAWENNVVQAAADRKFDLELRLLDGAPAAQALAAVASSPLVRRVEQWSIAPAALGSETGLDVTRRYPDGGHGTLSLRSAPPDTTLVARTMLAGRWLQPGDRRAAVLNAQAIATVLPGAAVGSRITINIEQRPHTFEVVGVVRDILAPGAVFVSPQSFDAATGAQGQVNALRVELADPAQAATAARELSAALARQRIGVKAALTEKSFAAAQGAHIEILVGALGFIAAVMAIVGLLGLASSLGTSVVERTREFGVMRALGAPSGAIVRSVLYEGVFTALASAVLAVCAAVLPSAVVGRMLASISSQELALTLSPSGAALWVAGVVLAALAASYYPATRASGLTIKQTLDWEYA